MLTSLGCNIRVDDATLAKLKDSNPRPYIDTRILNLIALFWRIGAISHN